MMYNHKLINPVSRYVTNMFVQNEINTPFLVYHNLHHTNTVVMRTEEIATFYSIDGIELFVILSAAWFHDCGHLFGSAIDHEQRSVVKMQEYMEQSRIDHAIINDIQSCILATRLPGNPQTLIEKILCDADLYHFGTDDFFVSDLLVKKEFQLRNNFLPKNWDEASLALLKNHRFHTDYCKKLLDDGKIKNIIKLSDKINSRN